MMKHYEFYDLRDKSLALQNVAHVCREYGLYLEASEIDDAVDTMDQLTDRLRMKAANDNNSSQES